MAPTDPEIVERIVEICRRIQSSSADVESMAVITSDGVPIAWTLPLSFTDAQVQLISACGAAFASLAPNLTQELNAGEPNILFIEAVSGGVFIRPIIDNILLIVLCRPYAKMGLLYLDTGPWQFLSPSGTPIFPYRPPGHLSAHAKPE